MDKITVEFRVLENIYKLLKKQGVTEVSFEFLIGSCFPHIMDNIKDEMKRQHAMGFAEGLKESEKNDD